MINRIVANRGGPMKKPNYTALICLVSAVLTLCVACIAWKRFGVCVQYDAKMQIEAAELNNNNEFNEPPATEQKSETGHHTSVAICTILKDQHEYLREWVEHNLNLGIDTIYLYDHNSKNSMVPVVEDLIIEGKVNYRSFTHFHFPFPHIKEDDPTRFVGAQLYVNQDCLQTFGHRHDWLGFIDVDEFLVMRNDARGMSMPDLLDDYKEYSGLGLNWRVIGSSGHIKRPDAGVLESYTHCLPEDDIYSKYIKLFMQPKWTTHVYTHGADITGQWVVMDDYKWMKHGTPSHDTTPEHTSSRVALYHYYTKSQEEAYEKIKEAQELIKQGKWWPTGGLHVNTTFVDNINKKADANPEKCLDGLPYAQKGKFSSKRFQALAAKAEAKEPDVSEIISKHEKTLAVKAKKFKVTGARSSKEQ